ncbi:MAG: hypothetical protein AAFV29_24755, partial [Myxococcota bacterium]
MANFVEDAIEAATLSVRKQTLDVSHERFDQFDPAQHRGAIEEILASWGLDVQRLASQIDAVVFGTRYLTDAELKTSWGQAVVGETISGRELGDWNERLEAHLTQVDLMPDNTAAIGGDDLSARLLDMARSMPIQGKIEVSFQEMSGARVGVPVITGVGVGGSAARGDHDALEIKRGVNDFEVRFRSGRGNYRADISLSALGILGVAAKGQRKFNDGFAVHFDSVDALQKFLKVLMSENDVEIADLKETSGIERTKQGAVVTGVGGSARTAFKAAGVNFEVGPGITAERTGESNFTSYRSIRGDEEKVRRIYSYNIDASLAVTAGLSVMSASMTYGASKSGTNEYKVVDRHKFEYGDDGVLKGAEYFRASP